MTAAEKQCFDVYAKMVRLFVRSTIELGVHSKFAREFRQNAAAAGFELFPLVPVRHYLDRLSADDLSLIQDFIGERFQSGSAAPQVAAG